ncbi:hypothetical protein GCM10010358_15180 [Streptomyces minutiscleroticus]|uniref:Uncharacterized protein n=1 Tax=Streptomyces minutiscleroticus TaxID=68238 RepID=A0A918KFS4_9ACTN|nr:hypothetical protein GCM10010358_15180 [Streptomyces minutiscleroticus]
MRPARSGAVPRVSAGRPVPGSAPQGPRQAGGAPETAPHAPRPPLGAAGPQEDPDPGREPGTRVRTGPHNDLRSRAASLDSSFREH